MEELIKTMMGKKMKIRIGIFFFLCGVLWPIDSVIATSHRVRVDLKIRSPELLREKAEAMSKPFPYRGNPLSWGEIIDIAGRTPQEMKQLVSNINHIGGTNIKACLSRQCIVLDIEVDDNDINDDGIINCTDDGDQAVSKVEDLVHRRLQRSLQDSGDDHTIINRILGLGHSSPKKNHDKDGISDTNQDVDSGVKKTAKMNGVISMIANDMTNSRSDVTGKMTEKQLNDIGNYEDFSLVAGICDYNNTTGYISMENPDKDCPTELTVTAYPWYAEEWAVSQKESYTFSTGNLKTTAPCSQYNGTVCKNSLNPLFKANDGSNVTMKFRDDTVLRIIEFGGLFKQGVAYYNIEITYTEHGISSDTDTNYAIGPTTTPKYGNKKYNVPEGSTGAGLGVTALGSLNVYSKKALSTFLEGYALPVPEIKLFESSMYPQTNNISACSVANSDCGESNLDVQSIASYGSGADFGFIPVGNPEDFNSNMSDYEIFVLYREIFIENNVAPDVLSLSWDGPLTSYLQDLDNILEEFTAMGITVLMATGDSGTGGDSPAFFNEGQPCSPDKYVDYSLTASSPWILAVGATMDADVTDKDKLEPVACMGPVGLSITSTGVISPSDIVELPEYQKDAVEGYLSSETFRNWPFQPRSIPSPGRGIPDVSAYGSNIPVVLEDSDGNLSVHVAGGTSASTPAFAGLLLKVRKALLDDPKCKGIDVKFGHINPMIYWAAENRPDAFTDITIGTNVFDGDGGDANAISNCGQGFVATDGWDPVTGVGMMNFPSFVEAAVEYYCTGI